MNSPLLRLGFVVLVVLSAPGCSLLQLLIGDQLPDPVVQPLDQALNIIDRGIEDLGHHSDKWQDILKQVANDLPKEISATIRTDAQNLATRSIAAAGTQLHCSVDFLAARATAGLRTLRARLKGEAPPPALPPAFCLVAPNNIQLSDDPARWTTVTLDGYDLDVADATGRVLQVMMEDVHGAILPFPEAKIGRTTHYQMTLNLQGLGRTLYDRKIAKLRLTWSGNPSGYPEIVVGGWTPRTQTVTVSRESTTYTPPHVGGDKDFDTDDDEHMSIDVRGELRWGEQLIETRTFMYAREERSDWTRVEGWTAWQRAYEAPANWKIVAVTPTATARQTANITDHGVPQYGRPGGEVVTKFEVFGDRNGDEAGTYTRVVTYWRDLSVTLQEKSPAWLALETP